MPRRACAFILALAFAALCAAAAPSLAADWNVAAKGSADQKAHMDKTPTYPSNLTLPGHRLGGRGMAVADFSGDGIPDLLFASPLGETIHTGGLFNGEGVVFYQKGPIDAASNAGNEYFDVAALNSDTQGGRVFGRYAKGRLGFALAAGDVNGDGKPDFVLGSAGDATTGEVYVIFAGDAVMNPSDPVFDPRNLHLNKPDNFAVVDLVVTNIPGANFNAADTSGITLAVGDANGDGLADLAIGAPNYDSGRGAVFLVYGQGVGAAFDASGSLGLNTIKRIDGAAVGDRLGFSVAFADVCGDTKKDLLIGAKGASSSAGRVYVLRGAASANWGGDFILSIATESGLLESTITGASANDEFGFAVAGGNVNGSSGYDDVIVGARHGLESAVGEVYIFYGASSLSAAIAASSANAKILGVSVAERFGSALHCADMSGDGIADIAVGAPEGRNFADSADTGRAYLVFGDASLPAATDLSLSLSSVYVFYGEYPGGRFGCNLTSANLSNRTGQRDLLVAAERGAGDSQGAETGCVYQLFYVRGPNAPTGVTAIASPNKNTGHTISWTYSDPQGNPQAKYQVQFAKDAAFTTALQDSGELSGANTSYNVTLTGGAGTYWYRVRTANAANWGGWSAVQSFVHDPTQPTAVETSTWGGGNWVGSTGRVIALRADDNYSAHSTLSVYLWRSRQAGEDLNGNGICESGEGAATTLATADPVGTARAFSLSVNDAAVPAGEGVRIWINPASTDLAGNTYQNRKAYNDPLVSYTLRSALGPLASNFTPPDGAYVTTSQPTVQVRIVDDDSGVNTAEIVFSFSNDTKTVGLTPAAALYYDVGSQTLVYSSVKDGVSYSNGTYSANLYAAKDGLGNPLQNPTVWRIVLDNTPPGNVADALGLDGGQFPISPSRLVRFGVSDNIRNAASLTAHYWRGTVDDTNANRNIDDGEVKTFAMSVTGAAGVYNVFDLYVNETGMATGDTVAVWVTGADHAGNAIDAATGGSKWTPKVAYHVHSTQGPTVTAWAPVAPAYFNTARPTFAVKLADDDIGVNTTSVVLQVLSTEYRVTDVPAALTWSVSGLETTFTYTAPSNLAEGTVDVWVKSAADRYGNVMGNVAGTRAVHFVDLTGPLAVVGSEFPARGVSTSNTQTEIRFTLTDNLSGLDLAAARLALQFKRGGSTVNETHAIGARLSYANNVMKFTPDPAVNPYFEDGSVTVTLTVGKDVAGNALQVPFSWEFAINTSGPEASNLYPSGVITSNRQHEIRCKIESAGSEIATTSVQLKVNATTYYIPGAMLAYDPVTKLLTFNPAAGGVTYPDGTVTVSLLQARDLDGFNLQDAPVTWWFVVDTTGPVVVNNAGTDYERKPAANAWVTTNRPLLKIPFADTPQASGFNYNTLNFRVNGGLPGYTYNSAGVAVSQKPLSATENGYLVTFDPATAGVSLVEGTNSVSVTAFADLAGNALKVSALNDWSFKVDSVRPSAAGYSPSGYVTANTESVRVTLSDATSGLDTASIALLANGSPVAFAFDPATRLLTHVPVTPWAEGSVQVEIYVRDVAGNEIGDGERYREFFVDTVRPTVSGGMLPALGAVVSEARPEISVVVFDGGSGINPALVTMSLRDGSGAAIAATASYDAGSGRVRCTPSVDLPEGTVAVTLTSLVDRAGWSLATPFAWYFFADRTPPAARDIKPVPGELVPSRTRPVELTLTDGTAGVDPASIILTVNGNPKTVGADLVYDAATGRLRYTHPGGWSDGAVTVTLTQARDRLGFNYTSVPNPLSTNFLVDGAAPTAVFTAPTGTITANAPIEATLADAGAGIDTASISLVVAAESSGRLYATGVTGSILVYAEGVLTFNPAAAGIAYPNDTIAVTLAASDLVGNQLNGGAGVTHRFLRDSAGPVVVVSPDSRVPGPATKPYVNRTDEVVRFALADRPSGIDWSTLVVTVTVNGADRVHAFGSAHLSVDQATGAVTYDPKPDELFPAVANVTVTVTEVKDRSPLALAIDKFSPDRSWSFSVDANYVVASSPSPAAGAATADRLAPLSLRVESDSPVDPAKFVFKVAGTTREVGAYPSHTLLWDAGTGRLVYTPTLATRYDEGTLSVVLAAAGNVAGGSLQAPFAWDVVVDSVPPVATALFPLPGQVVNDNRGTVTVELTDAGSGVVRAGADRVRLQVRRPGDAAYVDYFLDTSPYLSYDGRYLHFNATHTFLFPEGTTWIRLETAKDRAGNMYAGYPLEYSFSVNTERPTIVSHTPAAGAVLTTGNAPVSITFDCGIGSAGIDAASIRLALRNNAAATFEVTTATPGAAWNAGLKRFTYTPPAAFAEGTVSVALAAMRDLEGHDYTASAVPYGFHFLVDATAPVADAANVTPKSPAYATRSTAEIRIPVNDGPAGSGIDLATVRLELSYPGSGGTFAVGIGDNLSLEGGALLFRPSVPYGEGTVHVRLAELKDRAGFDVTPRPLDFDFVVDLFPPRFDDASRSPADGSATDAARPPVRVKVTDSSSGLDLSTLNFTVNGVPLTAASPGVTYDGANGWLSFSPPADLPEGTVAVVVTSLSDRAGFPARGLPSDVAVPLYGWSFCADRSRPTADSPIPQHGSYRDDPSINLYLRVLDAVSGVGTYGVTLLDAASNPIPHSVTRNAQSGVLTIDPSGALPAGLITCRVAAFDRAGNGLAGGEYVWQFTMVTSGPVVTLVSPAENTRTAGNLSPVRWLVDDSSEVQSGTIRLTLLDGAGSTALYTTATPNLVFSYPNLTFDPRGVPLPDGTTTVTLEMRNVLGKPIAGRSSWLFVIDTKGPRVTPAADCTPPPGGVTDRGTQEIVVTLADALGAVDAATISLTVTNPAVPGGSANYGIPSAGLSYDTITKRLTFNPVPLGIEFATGEVRVSLNEAMDDIGNSLQGRPVVWSFTVVSDEPYVKEIRPAAGAYTRDTAQDVEIDLSLPGSTTLDQAAFELALAWEGAGSPKTLGIAGSGSPNANAGLTYDAAAKRVTLRPENAVPAIVFGDGTVSVTVRNVRNNLGKTMSAERVSTFVVDTVAPLVSGGLPQGYTAARQQSFSFLVTDPALPAGERVAPATAAFRVDNGTQSILLAGSSVGVTYSEATSRFTFNPAAAGVAWNEGSVSVVVTALADKAGNALAGTYAFGFTLDSLGPRALEWSPHATAVADPGRTLEIRFESDGSPIAPATLSLVVFNNALVKPLSGASPGVGFDPATGRFSILPAAAGFTLTEGSVSVQVLALQDAAGNALQNPFAGSAWEWFLDTSGPYVAAKVPPAGTPVTSNTQQEVGFRVADLRSGVDLASLAMRVAWWSGAAPAGSRDVLPATPGASRIVQPDGSVLFTFRPGAAVPPVTFANGTVTAYLVSARDGVGNAIAPLADRTMEVLVNTDGPVISDPLPLPGAVLGGGPGTISVAVVSTIPSASVVPASIVVRLYGLDYGAEQYPAAIRLQGGRIVVNPAAIPVAFRDGPVTFEVVRALDTYGNNLLPSADPAIGPDNAWDFTVDLTGPAASAADPPDGSVVGSATPPVRVRVTDFWSPLDVATGRLRVLTPAGEAFAPMTAHDAATGYATFDMTAAPLAAGRNDLTLTACADVHGNALQRSFHFTLWRDAEGPAVSNPFPAPGSAVRNRQTSVTARVEDALSTVDASTLKVGIANGTLSTTLAYPAPGLYYAAGSLLLDPAAAGLYFNEGTVTVTVHGGAAGLKDSLGNAMAADYAWSFAVLSRGPFAANPQPAAGTVTRDPQVPVSLSLVSELSTVSFSTVRLQVAGTVYTSSNPALTYSGGVLRFSPAAAGVRFGEGTVTVALLEARDLAGNPLENAPFAFAFVVDSEGPEAALGIGPVSSDDPEGVLLSLHFAEPLAGPPTLETTDGKGSVEVLTLDPVSGTTTVYVKRVGLTGLDLPLTFRYNATDALGNAYTDRDLAGALRTAEIATGLSLAGGVYHLLSFPALGSGTFETLAGGLPPAEAWRLYALDRDALRFRETLRVGPGFGYAFRHDRPTPVAPTLRGVVVDRARLDFRIGLKPGWNLIAAPFNFRLRYANLKIAAGGAPVAVTAPGNVWLDRAFFAYGIADGLPGFDLAGTDSDFEAHRAYFLYARDTAELSIPPLPLTASEISARPVPARGLTKPAGDPGWLLRIGARTARARDDWNYIGLLADHAAATLREPPYSVFPPYVNLRFIVDGAPDDYASLARPAGSARETWTFAVTADTPGETVTLAWPTPYALLNDRLTLTDLSTNAAVDMLRANEYRFAYDGERTFRVVYSRLTASTGGGGGGAADTTRPKVVSFWPKGLDAPLTTLLRVGVSEDLVASTAGSALSLRAELGGREVAGSVTWNPVRRELVFTPARPLDADAYFRATVMNSAVDPAGNALEPFEWTFKTVKPAEETRSLRVAYGPGWNLVSIPYYAADAAPGRVFSAPEGIGLVRYRNGAYQVYDPLDPRSIDPPAPGLGFWLRLAASREIEFSGRPASSERPFRVPLYANDWNQFGHPFDAPVLWNRVKFDTGTSEITLASAANGGYLLPSVYRYEGGSMRFHQAPDGVLEPGRGYFIFAKASGTLLVPPPAAGAPARAPMKRLDPASAWFVRVTLRAAGVEDGDNYFGCDSVALPGYDLSDAPKVEPPPPCVTLRQPRDFGPFRRYAADFRAPFTFPEEGGEEHTFTFEVAKSDLAYVDGELSFSFTRVPADYALTLVDELTGERRPLVDGAVVPFRAYEATRRFRVEVERK